jgi:hypothetical protein
LSFWESVDAVSAVGEDMECALPCADDDRFHVDPTVTHFQVREEGRGS